MLFFLQFSFFILSIFVRFFIIFGESLHLQRSNILRKIVKRANISFKWADSDSNIDLVAYGTIGRCKKENLRLKG